MIEIKTKENEDGTLIVTGYEGSDAILDLSGNTNITAIDKKAFLSCKCIKKLILPESIKQVGDWAFSKCSNLKSVRFKGSFNASIFGKGVFDSCKKIESFSFKDTNEDLKVLLADTISRLNNDQLLRSRDLGEKSWYEKWDLYLTELIDANATDENTDIIIYGEEDASQSEGTNLSVLCFKRLLHNIYMNQTTKEKLEAYIINGGFKKENNYAWRSLKEECAEEIDFFKLYLDIVKPDKVVINEMIADLDSTKVQARVFLINEAAKNESGDSFFDDLLF